MNTVTIDNATYKEMSDFARQNNVSIAEMLKGNWHDFIEYVKLKKSSNATASASLGQDFINRFSGSEWENEKSPVEVVEDYRRNSYSDHDKQIVW